MLKIHFFSGLRSLQYKAECLDWSGSLLLQIEAALSSDYGRDLINLICTLPTLKNPNYHFNNVFKGTVHLKILIQVSFTLESWVKFSNPQNISGVCYNCFKALKKTQQHKTELRIASSNPSLCKLQDPKLI